jgi:hypothetical protein
VGLVPVLVEAADLHVTARPPDREKALVHPSPVVLHAPRGRFEDLRAAAEVALKHDRPLPRVALGEGDHVGRVGAPPAVHHLVVVGDHGDVALGPGEQRHQLRLGAVDVLELVHHQPPPAPADPAKPVRVLFKQPHREHQQVIEGPRVRTPQLLV